MHKVFQHMQNTIAQLKAEKKSPGTISSTARAVREDFHAKATTPKTACVQAYLLFSAPEAPFPLKNTRANPNIQITSMICEKEALVRAFKLQELNYMKAKLSCEVPFKFQELKVWKRSFRARLPSISKSWRCEKEAFLRGFLPFQELKVWNRSFRARLLSNSKSCRYEKRSFCARLPSIPRVEDVKKKLSCEASFKFQELQIWETKLLCEASFHSKSWRYENEAFVRGFFQIPRVADMRNEDLVRGVLKLPSVEDMKMKLSCEASFKFQELQIWETKLSCEASLKFQVLKIWKRSFRARLLSNSKSCRYEKRSFRARRP